MTPSPISRLLPTLLMVAAGVATAGAFPLVAGLPRAVPANVLGVNALPPSKDLPNEPANVAEWAEYDALLAKLPVGTPVRANVYWHEWAWDKRLPYGFEHIDRKVRSLAKSGHPVLWEVTPLPWPGAWAWAPIKNWGEVATEDFPELDARFKLFVKELRASMRKYDMPERGTRLQIGNEPASGHPGGNAALPVGAWYDRMGELYERMVRGTDFGEIGLVLPALSVQDHDEATAARERETATPFLRRIVRAKSGGGVIAATHSRLFAPTETTQEYATHWLAVLNARLATARELSGCSTAIASEVYLFREDRGAVDDREEILRLVGPKLPPGVYLYKVGNGGDFPQTRLNVAAVKAAQGGQ